MLAKISEFRAFSRPYRQRYGSIAGTRLAMALRDWTRPQGEVYSVMVPGYEHAIWMRAGTSDRSVLNQILVTQELAFPITDSPKVIVDAGANIGLSSIFFAQRYPAARVIALEIDDRNFAMLQRNVSPYPTILPRKVGLWSKQTKLMVANPDDACWSFRAMESDNPDAPGIEAVGVRELVAEFGPIDLLKMDIEGGEFEVLSEQPEAWLGQIHTMAVELHDRFRPGCGEALERALTGFTFERSELGEYVILQNRRLSEITAG